MEHFTPPAITVTPVDQPKRTVLERFQGNILDRFEGTILDNTKGNILDPPQKRKK